EHQPDTPGEKTYVVQVEMPRLDDGKAPPAPESLRRERKIFGQESKILNLLYGEGAARYEYRYIKHLLGREPFHRKGTKTIDLQVILLDARRGFDLIDQSALKQFPDSFPYLEKQRPDGKKDREMCHVVIFGDVDPGRLSKKNLTDVADFVKK